MEFQEITLADFIQDVMPSTGHNRTQVLQMAVEQEEADGKKLFDGTIPKGRDFLYHHVDDHYRVTLSSIKAYFVENERPKRALSTKDENAVLRAKVAELEKKLGKEKGVVPGPTTKPTATKDEIPERDEDIPKKLSQTDFAAGLREELKGVKGPSAKAVASAKKKDIPKGN